MAGLWPTPDQLVPFSTTDSINPMIYFFRPRTPAITDVQPRPVPGSVAS